MLNNDDLLNLVRRLTEQNTRLIEENKRLKDRLDIVMTIIGQLIGVDYYIRLKIMKIGVAAVFPLPAFLGY